LTERISKESDRKHLISRYFALNGNPRPSVSEACNMYALRTYFYYFKQYKNELIYSKCINFMTDVWGCDKSLFYYQPRTQDLSLGKTLAAAGHVPYQKFSA
jgi:hypothetical protein